jgi:hypothetical protein
MRTILTLPFALAALGAAAQCPFTPTINEAPPILCPDEALLLTTQVYDAYQWYQDGNPIPGANGISFQVDYFNHSGSSFAVEATLDGCTTIGPSILVDGWAFLPPFVISEGDDPIFIGPFGEPTYCEGAFVQFTLGMPYTENIQWTLNGAPIPGATSSVLVVTETGSYHVSGAPSVCPESISQLGLTLDVTFQPPTQPVIQANDTELCATPAGNVYQWYLNGNAIIGADDPCFEISEPGVYTVFVDYGLGCQVISEPYLSTGVTAHLGAKPWSLYPSPSTGLLTVLWDDVLPMGTYWSVTDAAGREVRGGFMPAQGPLQLDLTDLPRGTYVFQAAHQHKALAPATRFTLAR